MKKRTRQCNNPAPKNNRQDCAGNSEESESCNEGKCPSKFFMEFLVPRGADGAY